MKLIVKSGRKTVMELPLVPGLTFNANVFGADAVFHVAEPPAVTVEPSTFDFGELIVGGRPQGLASSLAGGTGTTALGSDKMED